MTEEEFRKRDLVVKTISPVITVIGIVVGVWQFTEGERRNTEREYLLIAKQDSLEFMRKTWQERLDTYRRIAGVAGKVATSTGDPKLLAEAEREYNELYWGLAGFVDDPQVEEAMAAFRTGIYDVRQGFSTEDQLKVRADMLVDATRASLMQGWSEINKR